MRIETQKTVQNPPYPIKIQKDKPEPAAAGEQGKAVWTEDQIVLSGDAKQFRQLASQIAPEQVEIESVDEDRRALIQKRIAAGHYDQPEIEREIVNRILEFPSL